MSIGKIIFGFVLIGNLRAIKAIDFKDNGYYDVLVTISPDVIADYSERTLIVNNIKKWFSSGSEYLFEATERKTYIASVNILLPKDWTDITATLTTDYTFTDGVIRIDLPSALYLDTPYTVQPGGCGDAGEYTHVTPAFLENLDSKTTDIFGAPGKVFVREWAKLRYGVFEEYGYPGDDRYPMFYYNRYDHLVPNYCTDVTLNGYAMDMSNSGSCTLVGETGLPNDDCIFVIDNDENDNVLSSYMAVNFLPSVNAFCETSEGEYQYHDPYRPTKQNLMCNGQAVWEVMNQHDDFQNVSPVDTDEPDATVFNILRPQEAKYVIVLDSSGSMGINKEGRVRIDRMKESASNFVKYYINDGSNLGVTHFSTGVTIDTPLTQISSEDVRNQIADEISNLEANGGTCLGIALQEGLQVLNDKGTTGGVIIFLTDGQESCGNDIPGGITNPELLQDVVDQKVRIVTIAFGEDADDDLENLARISGGKTFFIPDGYDNEAINDAFRAAMDYDPAVPSSQQEVLIHSESFGGKNMQAKESFVIDQSVGKNLKIELNYNLPDKTNPKITITFPNGTLFEKTVDDNLSTLIFRIEELMEVGEYKYAIEMNNDKLQDDSFMDVRITTKAREENVPPFQTRCWTSIGNDELDASKENLVVLSEVSQGNNAIINATVIAFITREGDKDPTEVQLSDNGRGADLIAEDGIYSSYFTDYNSKKGRYTLECQTTNEDTAVVVKPNTAVVNEYNSKTYERWDIKAEEKGSSSLISTMSNDKDFGPQSPICCGSTTANVDVIKVKTGNFERKSSGGSFKVVKTPDSKDNISPSRIVDLKVKSIDIMDAITGNPSVKLTVIFTSPGDDLDDGIASFYELGFVDSKTLNTSKIDFDDTIPILEEDLTSGSLDKPLNANELVVLEFNNSKMNAINNTYILLARAVDEEDNKGDISNMARFCNECDVPIPTTTVPPPTTAIPTTVPTTTTVSTTTTTFWVPCATITTSDTPINYAKLLKCPQTAGIFWKLEDDTGVCSHTQAGWSDWEQSDDAQKSLEFYLDTDTRNGWISPASSTPQMSNCGIRSYAAFKDTTSVLAYNSVGSITIYYHDATTTANPPTSSMTPDYSTTTITPDITYDCLDIIVDNCSYVPDVIDTFHNTDSLEICQGVCDVVEESTCKYFIYHNDTKDCEVCRDEPSLSDCDREGAGYDTILQCLQDDFLYPNKCKNVIESDCTMQGNVLQEHLEILDEGKCLSLSQLYNGNYYAYEKSTKKCTVYDSNVRTCKIQHGPSGLPSNCSP